MRRTGLLVATISAVSMILQPVAFGQTQENWAAQSLKEYVKSNQKSGKNVTVKEFWEKNKTKLHPEWQKKFFPAVNLQKDERVPQMEVISVKGPGGRDTARLVVTLDNNKTISVELLGGDEKFARVNGVNVSYADLYNGDGFVEKVVEIPVVKAEAQRVEKMALGSSIVIPYQTFAKMSAQDKADYFVSLRYLMQAAMTVQENAFNAAQKEESASFINLVLEKAYAQNRSKDWVGKRCIVAGYVGTYVKETADGKSDTYCDSTKAIKNFAALNTMSGLTQNKVSASVYDKSCGQGSLRCNSFVYGYDRGSGSMCVKMDRKAAAFQKATATCDKASPLRKENLAADTEAMVKTLLAKENKNSNEFFKDGKVISEEKYNELMNGVVKDFNTFIDEALGTCGDSKNLDGTTTFGEPNQGGACTVLKDRKLAFMDGVALLKGKYDTPTPTPAPPPPIADEVGQCKTDSGKPGYYNHDCKCVAAGDAEAQASGRAKPEVKDGKCIVGKNPVPPPVAVAKKGGCDDRPMLEAPAKQSSGDVNCTPRSGDRLAGKDDKEKKKKKDEGCGFICPLLVIGLIGFGAYALTKSKHKNKPVDYTPPAPVPVPVTPTPTPITPVTPISPTLPIPTPTTGSETTPGASPGTTPAAGTR